MGTYQSPVTAVITAERIHFPLPPALELEARFEMEIYVRFMRHMREVPNSRVEIKVLSAIQFTADMMDAGDALVAKTLVDLGLRAPRPAFPPAFLDFTDRALRRTAWDSGGNTPRRRSSNCATTGIELVKIALPARCRAPSRLITAIT